MVRVLFVLAVLTLIVYALVEAFQARESDIRLMPRWMWVAAIICVPGFGAIAWLVLGRPRPTKPGQGPPRAPDDDPDFLRGL